LSGVTGDSSGGGPSARPVAGPDDRHDAFRLTELTDPGRPGHRFSATSIGDPSQRDVVYGGQLLAQMILASDLVAEDKDVASIHAIFARSARLSSPLEIDVDVIHDGRTMGSHSVTVHQGDRVCAQGLILRRLDAPDLIRHQPDMPEVAGPDDSPDTGQGGLLAPGSELRVVGGTNTWDPDAAVGPAELFVWVRLPDGSDHPALAQALLAYGTDGFLIGTAMLPHAGIGQNMAHRNIGTGVVSHTLTFHEPVPVGSWLLLAHESPYAGRGASYGRANVFTQDGKLVASFVQENMIRDAGPTDH
jgi:acyl-CoA thioesterase II